MGSLGKRKAGGRSRAGAGARKRRRFNMSGKKSLRSVARGQTYPFKRFVHAKVTITGSDVNPTQLGATSFQLSDVVDSSDFTNLFDQYKIAGVAYRWCIGKDPMYPTGNTNLQRYFPRLVWVHDYDEANVPTNISNLYQYPKMREFWFTADRNATRWEFIKPARLDVGFENAVNSSYHPQWKGFVDMASPSTPFYGLKYGTQQNYDGMQIYLQCKYYLVMKNVR